MEAEQILDAPIYVDVKAIYSEVVWTDIPIIITIAIHVTILLLGFIFRNNKRIRNLLFITCLAITFSSQYFGNYLADNWEKLGYSKNYFDEYGIFLAFTYALPPMVTAILLFSTLVGSTSQKLISLYLYHRNQKKLAEKALEKNVKETEEKNETPKEEEEIHEKNE